MDGSAPELGKAKVPSHPDHEKSEAPEPDSTRDLAQRYERNRLMSDTQQATSHEEQLAADLRAAMQGRDWRIESVLTFTHGLALQVYAKPEGSRSFKKVGPLLIRSEDQTTGSLLLMLGAMADGEATR